MSNVGKSKVTPCKHSLLNLLLGRESGASTTPKMMNMFKACGIKDVLWLDLTAGDGQPAGEGSFEQNCSPGIMARLATKFSSHNLLPIAVFGIEKQPATFARLRENVSSYMQGLDGWKQQKSEADVISWIRSPAISGCWGGSAHSAITYHLGDSKNIKCQNLESSLLFIYNDPNSVAEWALSPSLVSACPKFTTTLSTLGCNPNGLKRLSLEKRSQWYEHIQSVKAMTQDWHDLCLFSVGGADQWAYLISAPRAWQDRITDDCRRSFKAIQNAAASNGPTIVWAKRDPDGFMNLLDQLFLTKKELGALTA